MMYRDRHCHDRWYRGMRWETQHDVLVGVQRRDVWFSVVGVAFGRRRNDVSVGADDR